ncbi:MAG: hypothetical protein AAFU50_02230 [Pseudomonadota bacterium]
MLNIGMRVAAAAALASVFALPAQADGHGSLKDTGGVMVEHRATGGWGGFYFGGHAGVVVDRSGDKLRDGLGEADLDNDGTNGHSNNDDEDRDGTESIVDAYGLDDDTSFSGGLHFGFNAHHGRVVYGVENDWTFGRTVDFLTTLRGRMGVASHRTFVYGTAGLAVMRRRFDGGPEGGANFADLDLGDDDVEVGFLIGGGLEFKVGHNISLGGEALYHHFGDTDRDIDTDGDGNHDDGTLHFEDGFWSIRARLTYHFGGRDRGHVAEIPTHEPLK